MGVLSGSRRAGLRRGVGIVLCVIAALLLCSFTAFMPACASSYRVESHNGFPAVVQCVPGPTVVEDEGGEEVKP